MNIPEAEIENARNHIRAAAREKPVELRFAPMKHTWPKAPPYARHYDVIGIEPYPYWGSRFCTGGLNLRDRILAVPYWTDEAVRLAAGKPVWVVIQAHVGGGLRPTPAQFRSSAYLAVNHGASGIIVAGYKRRLWEDQNVIGLGDPQLSDLRLEAARLAGELRQLSPAILAGAIRGAVEAIDHVGYIDINAFASPEDDRLYIVAVNTTDDVVDPIFQIHLKTEPAIEVLGESLMLEHNEGRFTARFAPYETHVYVLQALRFDPEAAELLGVDEKVIEEQEPGED
jgi:hypothetical protein